MMQSSRSTDARAMAMACSVRVMPCFAAASRKAEDRLRAPRLGPPALLDTRARAMPCGLPAGT
jgi:hypothetical protein